VPALNMLGSQAVHSLLRPFKQFCASEFWGQTFSTFLDPDVTFLAKQRAGIVVFLRYFTVGYTRQSLKNVPRGTDVLGK